MKYKLCATIDRDNLYGNGWHNENGDENDTRLEYKKDQMGYTKNQWKK